MVKKEEPVPSWFAWVVERGVVFWRVILLVATGGLLALAVFIHGRLREIEQNLSYQSPNATPHVEPVGMPDEIAKGQKVFVPAYSHVYHQDGKPFPLTTTLSIQNTDATEPIVVSSVKYYGTGGKLIRNYVEQPKRIAPLASVEFLVEQSDTAGGSGAKFIVQWVAEKEVHEPVVQTIMVGTTGGQGLSFVTNGIVLEETDEE